MSNPSETSDDLHVVERIGSIVARERFEEVNGSLVDMAEIARGMDVDGVASFSVTTAKSAEEKHTIIKHKTPVLESTQANTHIEAVLDAASKAANEKYDVVAEAETIVVASAKDTPAKNRLPVEVRQPIRANRIGGIATERSPALMKRRSFGKNVIRIDAVQAKVDTEVDEKQDKIDQARALLDNIRKIESDKSPGVPKTPSDDPSNFRLAA